MVQALVEANACAAQMQAELAALAAQSGSSLRSYADTLREPSQNAAPAHGGDPALLAQHEQLLAAMQRQVEAAQEVAEQLAGQLENEQARSQALEGHLQRAQLELQQAKAALQQHLVGPSHTAPLRMQLVQAQGRLAEEQQQREAVQVCCVASVPLSLWV